MEALSDYEALIRMTVFTGIFVLFAALESIFPRRNRTKPRFGRWFANFGMLFIANLVMRFGLPLLAIGVAFEMQARRIGLFNLVDWPVWLEILLAVILLDLAIWAQHVAMHHVPWLWALHRVHHADEDLDASSGIRFHPLEQLISMVFKMAVVGALGPAPLAVFLFEVILNATSMFSHASLNLPIRADAILRKLIITPDFHRVHHSVHPDETNSNYGFCLSLWDRLFRTYTAQPREGHETMPLGLDRRPDGNTASLWWSLILPFRKSGT